MPRQRQPQHIRDYADELRRQYGGLMKISDIAEELGKVSEPTAYKFVADVPSVNVNGRRRWRVSEVAKKICESEN